MDRRYDLQDCVRKESLWRIICAHLRALNSLTRWLPARPLGSRSRSLAHLAGAHLERWCGVWGDFPTCLLPLPSPCPHPTPGPRGAHLATTLMSKPGWHQESMRASSLRWRSGKPST